MTVYVFKTKLIENEYLWTVHSGQTQKPTSPPVFQSLED